MIVSLQKKESVHLVPQKAVSSSLVLEEEVTSLTQQEQQINDLLNNLPSFCLDGTRTPKWKERLHRLSFGVLGFVSLFSPFLIMVSALKTDLAFWSAMSLVLGVFLCFAGMMTILDKIGDRLKISATAKEAVIRRQSLIKKATYWVVSPMLKGRLSELYFLCGHKDIDRDYWVKMNETLENFIAHMEKQNNQEMEEGQMVELRNDYRNALPTQGVTR